MALSKMVQSAAHALTALHCTTMKMGADFDFNALMAFSCERQSEAWAKDVARRTPKSAEHTVDRPFIPWPQSRSKDIQKLIDNIHTFCPTATPPPDT